ncbi:hypothetical protein [Melittangium boletus]|uniref:Aminoglycoside phosphotransferase domain-containing protein n=1 Tax=Melittangium boletus DSM 14713 TaxID=1294270 RepID=A0A250II76_9BACT|nr:hypothetical protein [Melittangium boletus]ATB30626.1 hypothetical protein MEBOL_004087 [Melittangium boletus DSM 14713]
MLLGTPETLEGGAVRAQVRGGPVPGVLLKHFPDEPVRGFDDWAGSAYLTGRGLEAVPRFLAGDVEGRFFLQEDPGPGRTLEELLRGRDTRSATGGLLATARMLGQLHASTLGAQSSYELVRQALPPRHERVRMEEARWLLEHEGRLKRWLTAVGTPLAPGTHADLEAVSRALADPGALLAFTHGGLSPASVLLTLAGPRLPGMAGSGMRHALYDALLWLVTLPLPEELLSRADITHRLTLSSRCEAAQVDSEWARARATVVLARTVTLLQAMNPRMLDEDPSPAAGAPSLHATLLHHLARCRESLATLDAFTGLGQTLSGLEARLRERWTVAPFVWPALRQPGV